MLAAAGFPFSAAGAVVNCALRPPPPSPRCSTGDPAKRAPGAAVSGLVYIALILAGLYTGATAVLSA